MNAKIYLTYNLKKIGFRLNNKNKYKNNILSIYDNNKIVCNNNQSIYKYTRKVTNFINNKFAFLLFAIIWFVGNKTGKYITKKYIFKKDDIKLFIFSDLI